MLTVRQRAEKRAQRRNTTIGSDDRPRYRFPDKLDRPFRLRHRLGRRCQERDEVIANQEAEPNRYPHEHSEQEDDKHRRQREEDHRNVPDTFKRRLLWPSQEIQDDEKNDKEGKQPTDDTPYPAAPHPLPLPFRSLRLLRAATVAPPLRSLRWRRKQPQEREDEQRTECALHQRDSTKPVERSAEKPTRDDTSEKPDHAAEPIDRQLPEPPTKQRVPA